MNSIEWYIIAAALVGWVMWVRGCIRQSVGSCAAGLFVGAVCCAIYFVVFNMTQTPYLGGLILGAYLLPILLIPQMRRTRAGGILIAACVALTATAFAVEYKIDNAGNALLVLEPYRSGHLWRFDEPRFHLKGEPFVSGALEMIDKMSSGIPGSDRSIRLIFSQRPFPGSQFRLDWLRGQDAGNWYYSPDCKIEGWLCPALFKFFPRAPRHIYVRAEAD